MTATFAMANSDVNPTRVLFGFDGDATSDWAAVNDTVMGGRSDGDARIADRVLTFSGELSLENNGGFSSVRRPVDLDLSDQNGIRLRVRGDGRDYQLRLHTDSRYYGRPVAYSASFPTRAGEWIDADVAFARLQASFRGRKLEQFEFDPSQVKLIGIMLADKNPGTFQLEIKQIAAY